MRVYIPESIFMEDNPWDGRTRYGVFVKLEDALAELKKTFGDDLVCAEPTAAREYSVHHPGDTPGDSVLWIFEEDLTEAKPSD